MALHLYFTGLDAIEKYFENSGLETASIEIGSYFPAARRGTVTGKTFIRGVEFHVIQSLSIFLMIYEAQLNRLHSILVKQQCEELKKVCI